MTIGVTRAMTALNAARLRRRIRASSAARRARRVVGVVGGTAQWSSVAAPGVNAGGLWNNAAVRFALKTADPLRSPPARVSRWLDQHPTFRLALCSRGMPRPQPFARL